MRWDLVREDNQTLAFTKRLIALRREKQAIRFGNFRIVNSDRLLAFERYTDKARDTVIVVVNPSKKMVMERVMIANSKLMNGTALKDILNPQNAPVRVLASMITVSLPPYSAKILSPDMQWSGGYSAYKRVN
jgi:glycosidase